MNRAWQKCQKCGDPVRPGGGVLCVAHVKEAQQERLAVGSIGQQIVARRANELMELVVAAADPDVGNHVNEIGQNMAVLAAVAADQLARAWGVRVGKV